jgi:heme exporter protein D
MDEGLFPDETSGGIFTWVILAVPLLQVVLDLLETITKRTLMLKSLAERDTNNLLDARINCTLVNSIILQ